MYANCCKLDTTGLSVPFGSMSKFSAFIILLFCLVHATAIFSTENLAAGLIGKFLLMLLCCTLMSHSMKAFEGGKQAVETS